MQNGEKQKQYNTNIQPIRHQQLKTTKTMSISTRTNRMSMNTKTTNSKLINTKTKEISTIKKAL